MTRSKGLGLRRLTYTTRTITHRAAGTLSNHGPILKKVGAHTYNFRVYIRGPPSCPGPAAVWRVGQRPSQSCTLPRFISGPIFFFFISLFEQSAEACGQFKRPCPIWPRFFYIRDQDRTRPRSGRNRYLYTHTQLHLCTNVDPLAVTARI